MKTHIITRKAQHNTKHGRNTMNDKTDKKRKQINTTLNTTVTTPQTQYIHKTQHATRKIDSQSTKGILVYFSESRGITWNHVESLIFASLSLFSNMHINWTLFYSRGSTWNHVETLILASWPLLAIRT